MELNYLSRFTANNIKLVLITIVPILIIVTLFIFALNAYPVLGGDSAYYIPSAINHRLDRGLVNQLSPQFLVGDLSGTGRHLISPPLFPLVISWLMPTGTSQGAHIAIFILYAITIIAAAVIYKKVIISDRQEISWYGVAIYIATLFALASAIIFDSGRPETLSRLLISLALLGLLRPRLRWLWLFFGFLLGLALATNPASAILFAPLIGLFFAFYHPPKKALAYGLSALMVSLFTFVFVLEVFGYGLAPTTKGMYHHFSQLNSQLGAQEYIDRVVLGRSVEPVLQKATTRSGVIKPFLSDFSPLGAVSPGRIVALAILCMSFWYSRHRKHAPSPILWHFFVILTAAIFSYFIFIRPGAQYLFSIAPLFFLVIVHWTTNYSHSIILKSVAFIVIVAGSVFFFQRLTLFPFFIKDGMSLREARAIFKELSLNPDERLNVDSTIWAISENYGPMRLWNQVPDVLYPTGITIMREGFNGWKELPANWDYCRKTNDFFIRKEPLVFGLPITETGIMPGYAFSIYDCPSSKKK